MHHLCKRCGCQFTRRNNLRTHLLKRKPCNDINGCEQSVQDLLSDLEQLKSIFPCELCGKEFESSQGKYQHKQLCVKKTDSDSLKATVSELQEVVHQLKTRIQNLMVENLQLAEKLHNLTCKRDEKFYQNILEKYLGGSHKTLSCGVTDVTTETCHAEIKEWKCWKEAIGQLTCYNAVDPKEKLEMYLFGKYRASCKDEVLKVASSCNIQLYEFGEENNIVKIFIYPSQESVFEYDLSQS